MPSRKRSLDNGADVVSSGNAILDRIRNMWQFANLCQWVYIFGKAVKLDDAIDIEEIESACLKPDSTILSDIALAILRLVSNHRGLTHDNIDSQAQKQYLARAPDRNPFGSGEYPAKFQEFDVLTKIAVLQQFTQWCMVYPDRLREKMDEQRDTEQTSWRIEPYGWDSEDRTYFVLDDNRVYRLTEAPPNPTSRPKKKKNNSYSFGKRSSKRRRTETGVQETEVSILDQDEETVQDGLGGMKWECLAITLDEVRGLLEDLRKSRDENEKILRRQLEDHLVPILEKQEEGRKRKALQRERELINLAKMATAKRSSRIANKIEQQRHEEKLKEEEQMILKAEEARRKEEDAQLKREQERDARMASRENRLKEREARRMMHEEELAQLSAEDRNRADHPGRVSERHLKTEIERNKQALEELDADEDWVFDCICGLFGQVDDGTHSVACESCNVWQHSKCLGISEEEAERPEFHFVCNSCHRRQQEMQNRPKPPITLKVHRSTSQGQLSSTKQTTTGVTGAETSSSVQLPNTSPSLQATKQESPGVRSAVSTVTNAISNHPSSEPSPILTRDPGRDPTARHDVDDYRTAETDLLGVAAGVTRSPLSYQATSTPAPASSVMPVSLTRPAHNREVAPSPLLGTPNIGQGQAGISPIKQSPHGSLALGSSNTASINSSVLVPAVTLSPSTRQPILTPPTKQPEPVRAPERQ